MGEKSINIENIEPSLNPVHQSIITDTAGIKKGELGFQPGSNLVQTQSNVGLEVGSKNTLHKLSAHKQCHV